MRRVAAALLLALPSVASALRQPATQAELAERAAIAGLMKKEKAAYEKALRALDAPPSIDGPVDPVVRRAQRDQKELALVAAHKSVMDEIVRRTVALYDIRPGPTSGEVVVGAFMGDRPDWSPVYAPEVAVKYVVRGNERIPLEARGQYMGIAWADGSVELNDKAFQSPAFLAAVIYHESIHFEQLTTWGRGDKHTAVRLEIEAHSQSSSDVTAAILALTGDEKKKVRRAFAEQMELFHRMPSANMVSMQFDASGDPLSEGMRKAEAAVAADRQRRAEEAAIRDAERIQPAPLNPEKRDPEGYVPAVPERRTYVSPPEPVPLNPSRSFGHERIAGLMLQVSKDACAYPPMSLESSLAHVAWWDFSKVGALDSLEAGLSPCELRVFRRLADFGRNWYADARITAADVRAAAAEPYSAPSGGGVVPPNQSHAPVNRKVEPLLRGR